MEVGQHSKETDLEVNIARLVEWIGAHTPLAEIHHDPLAHLVGLRRREVVSLTWSQVDWAAGIIRVIQKGDKPHVIPITPEVTDILWPLRGHHETHVFTFMAKRTRTCAKSGNRYERGTRYPISY